MPRISTAAAMVCGGLWWFAPPLAAQTTTKTGPDAVVEAVLEQFDGIARATNALDLDRLLGYYERSDALT